MSLYDKIKKNQQSLMDKVKEAHPKHRKIKYLNNILKIDYNTTYAEMMDFDKYQNK